ncbi:Uncharacterized protein Fot_55997 [Forsythia ovata]|uniref:Uncharacterized protein n=1 Tax=Forsythia ovata TaxID=205694 RepID=A0ABD1P243_9LAMI
MPQYCFSNVIYVTLWCSFTVAEKSLVLFWDIGGYNQTGCKVKVTTTITPGSLMIDLNEPCEGGFEDIANGPSSAPTSEVAHHIAVVLETFNKKWNLEFRKFTPHFQLFGRREQTTQVASASAYEYLVCF